MTHLHPAAPAIGGISIPDSKLTRAITEFVRDTETELLFNHSSRVYFSAPLRAGNAVLASILNCCMQQPCFMISG